MSLQAVELIQELRSTETDLKKTKRRLKRRRDEYMSILVASAGLNRNQVTKSLQELSRAGFGNVLNVSASVRSDPNHLHSPLGCTRRGRGRFLQL